MNKNFILQHDVDKSMKLRQFDWEIENNYVTLSWQWPVDRSVRLALVFRCEEENPNLEDLIQSNYHHDVIVRDLASNFTVELPEGRSKFLICPAYFDDNKNISVCMSSFITDWVYKRLKVSVRVLYSPISFSQFQKATLSVTSDYVQPDAISYVIQENGQTIASYPLDSAIITGGGYIYISKQQTVKFILNPNYAHLIELNES
ncbi:MAG: hypothetical protein FWC32_12775 [Firmicutes bacterium]|nr:hypothetical protein [Bacillota bacterium]